MLTCPGDFSTVPIKTRRHEFTSANNRIKQWSRRASRTYESIQHEANVCPLKSIVHMALKAAVKLAIPGLTARAEGRKALLAKNIVLQLPTKSIPRPNSSRNLQGPVLMVQESTHSEAFNVRKQPQHGLAEISEPFVRSNAELTVGSTSAPLFASPMLNGGTKFLHNSFMTEQEIMTYDNDTRKQPEFRPVSNDTEMDLSKMDARELVYRLQQSGALESLNTLVDVRGGREGTIVAQIVAQNPHIRCINYDLPYVIAKAPKIKGVLHIAGDYFESIPAGGTMFLKHIIHNYGDEDAIQILENCFKALPTNGKVILAESILQGSKTDSFRARYVETVEPMMLGCFAESRERTAEEYQKLLATARFSRFTVTKSPGGLDLIQALKE